MTPYVRPRSIIEAINARFDHPDWMVLAGGTDLMVNAPHRAAPHGIIDLWDLAELRGIDRMMYTGGRESIFIRPGTTWRQIISSETVQHRIPILAAAAREIGALQIQVRGTIGGNVANSSPVGDSLPVLLALDASIHVRSMRSDRVIPYAEYCTGYRTTALAADELITLVSVPAPAPGTKLHWRKVGTRRAQSISKVMAAAAITIDSGRITAARIGLGAVADRPIRAIAAEQALIGRAPGREAAEAAAAALATSIRPISDVRSTADYRLEVARNLIARFVIASA